MEIRVQGTASDIKKIWVVKWYKPWTWLRRGWSMYNVELTSMKISIDKE